VNYTQMANLFTLDLPYYTVAVLELIKGIFMPYINKDLTFTPLSCTW